MMTSNNNFVSQIKDVYDIPTGMPLSVWQNKYSRVKRLIPNPSFNPNAEDTTVNSPMIAEYQTWEERITDVVEGSFSLDRRLAQMSDNPAFYDLLHSQTARPGEPNVFKEFRETLRLSKQGVMAYAGRHLQHGDRNQREKLGELFTNCSTGLMSWTSFWLLLKGCFRAGTPVLMSDGSYKAIEDIVPGDSVKSWDEQDKQFCDQLVSRLNVNDPKPMVKVTFADGKSVVCTEDHKFLLEDGSWVQAKDLSGKDVKSY